VRRIADKRKKEWASKKGVVKSGKGGGATEIEPWAHRTFRLIGRWSTLKLHDDAVIHT